MSKLEGEPAQISVNYNGNFADRIKWQDDKLAEFARVSDLRTNITIKDSDDNPQLDTENLGGFLIRKKLASPLEFFGNQTYLGDRVRVSTDFDSGEAVLNLNHHIITQDVVRRSKGRIDERLFVEQVSSLVNQGLGNILAQEKKEQFVSSLLIDGKHLALTGLAVGILGGISYGFFALRPFGHLIEAFVPPEPISGDSTIDLLNNIKYIAYHSLGLVFDFIFGSATTLRTLLSLLDGGRDLLHEIGNDDYIKTLGDLNPLSHVKNFAAGEIYLATKGKRLVSLLPKD